ncbi:MAG TPA: SDR family NAD(P)-dependent oxidoreductase [Candidatus Acidoferrum sp.]|nr:SDR family NAD(P)-dependent oxidoreductase [Candidatus Acidoferrum sp.]
MNLPGKVAIITGSGGEGSGRAEALRLASEGCRVVVSDINESGGLETVRRIMQAGGHAAFCRCDVSQAHEVEALVNFAERTFGGLDILVNNASGPGYKPGAPPEEWLATIEIDLLGAMFGVRYALPAMRRRRGGAIVNVGSTSALTHGPGHSNMVPYDIAKIGVLRMTTTLSALRDTDNIRVNCLVPHWVAVPEVKSYWEALTPEKRRANPRIPSKLIELDELTQAVVRLITDENLAGRVLILWDGPRAELISADDRGYVATEPYQL